MNITEAKIILRSDGRLRAYASITIDEALVIRDLKVIEGPNGLFVSMPSKKLIDGSFRDIVFPLHNEAREKIERAILDEYKKSVKAEEK